MADRDRVALREHEHVEHPSHVMRYAVVWAALLVLTFLTWGLSRFHIPGAWGVAVALGIATAKGALVALFFMHLWDQQGANRLVFLTSLVTDDYVVSGAGVNIEYVYSLIATYVVINVGDVNSAFSMQLSVHIFKTPSSHAPNQSA